MLWNEIVAVRWVAKFALVFGLAMFMVSVIVGCGKGGSVTGPSDPAPTATSRVVLSPLPEVPANRIFGYYAYGAEGAGCGWTNWTLTYATTVDAARDAALAARNCRQVVTFTPFRGEATSSKWDATWEDNKKLIREFADAGVLHSVYVADEPMAARYMDYAELSRRIALVHAEGWKAMFTEQGGGIDKPHPAVDFYGLDWYDVKLHWVRYTLQRHPEINVLVPPAYMPYAGASPLNGDGTPNQEAWVEMAREQKVGIAFWMWPTCCGWTGAEDMPEVLAQHHALWARW